MKYEIYVGNPAGNITIFVKTPVDRADYIEIANKLMAKEEFKAEQVGFIVEPMEGGEGRMEMMGQEFCGNATRLFGYLIGSKKEATFGKIMVEVSGARDLLAVEYDLMDQTSCTEMPFPLRIEEIVIKDLNKTIPVVVLDGISHAIVEDDVESEELTKLILDYAKQQYDFDAFGIMYVNGEEMLPIVYVKGTDSLIYEGSCGSGTMAYTVYLSKDKGDGEYEYQIKQPGGIVSGTVNKEHGEIVSCFIGGRVIISDIKEVEI